MRTLIWGGGYAKYFFMFIKRKKNRSGTVSIVVAEKCSGIYKELITIGIAKSPEDINPLLSKGREWIDREQERRHHNPQIILGLLVSIGGYPLAYCICFVALKVYKELERLLKLSDINMSVDKVLELAKTIVTIQITLPQNKQSINRTMLMKRHQRIAQLFSENFWVTR